MKDNPWLLPDGIEEILPQEAMHLEQLRRQLLDLYWSWGYQLVIPPLIEYLESLLTGTGYDLDLQTFKITDQLTGRSMGIRADLTPQVARIDARCMETNSVSRLCYIGTTLHTQTDGFAGTRSPMQIGAELYGHAGIESDIEILCLMLKTLELAGLKDIYVDLGHVEVFRTLSSEAGLDRQQELSLFEMLQRKAMPEIEDFLTASSISEPYSKMIMDLVYLHGDLDILDEAREKLKGAGHKVAQAIDYVHEVANAVENKIPNSSLHIDLAELRGYHYKTGCVFAAFIPGQGQEIARGGRYDNIGKVFGSSRPATGFSTDIKTLVKLMPSKSDADGGIIAPDIPDSDLTKQVDLLRENGERVVCKLPGQNDSAEALACNRELVCQSGQWVVIPIMK